MTERRRAHWSDDLIEKVRYVYNSQITYADHDEEMESYYAVIAAVEDWHEKFVMHGAFRVLAERAASAEAEVQRVREACEPFGPMGSIAVWRVLRALDGGGDE